MVAPGIAQIPVEMLVDLDEKTGTLDECLSHVRAHAPVGSRAPRTTPPHRSEAPFNILLATDVNVGVVAFLIYRGRLDRATFYCWLALQVTFKILFVLERVYLAASTLTPTSRITGPPSIIGNWGSLYLVR